MWWDQYQTWRATWHKSPHAEATMSDTLPAPTEPAPIDYDPRDLWWPETSFTRCDADKAARHAIRWDSPAGTLRLCEHHSRRHATALIAAGWHITNPNLIS